MPWPDLLPSALLGPRTAFKEDLQAPPAEMYGVALRIPGEFFVTDSVPAEPQEFLSKFQNLIRVVRPVPAAHHSIRHPFQLNGLQSCTHVFKRVDTIRKPLEPPYTGPHEVVRRLNEKTYVIRVNGQDKTVSTHGLKPAFLELADNRPSQPAASNSNQPPQLAASNSHQTPQPATADNTTPRPSTCMKNVSFPSSETNVSGGRLDVAVEPRLPSPAAPPHRAASRMRKQVLQSRPVF
ncbi:PREDICTED: uncharacterized protein LOC106748712 [Dinoponera quadriceps]|uniref:Uncharacterized protein LOC106748712 n=1 Tax=Dinoponera quadriceps TaxID=609295 RepID=A0A6P3XWT2_DINQU|nr:PREDICTED: uncharacterized protein LOC106748712 [Dinoponera quadriceps]